MHRTISVCIFLNLKIIIITPLIKATSQGSLIEALPPDPSAFNRGWWMSSTKCMQHQLRRRVQHQHMHTVQFFVVVIFLLTYTFKQTCNRVTLCFILDLIYFISFNVLVMFIFNYNQFKKNCDQPGLLAMYTKNLKKGSITLLGGSRKHERILASQLQRAAATAQQVDANLFQMYTGLAALLPMMPVCSLLHKKCTQVSLYVVFASPQMASPGGNMQIKGNELAAVDGPKWISVTSVVARRCVKITFLLRSTGQGCWRKLDNVCSGQNDFEVWISSLQKMSGLKQRDLLTGLPELQCL